MAAALALPVNPHSRPFVKFAAKNPAKKSPKNCAEIGRALC
jgi:hypothetical protein